MSVNASCSHTDMFPFFECLLSCKRDSFLQRHVNFGTKVSYATQKPYQHSIIFPTEFQFGANAFTKKKKRNNFSLLIFTDSKLYFASTQFFPPLFFSGCFGVGIQTPTFDNGDIIFILSQLSIL